MNKIEQKIKDLKSKKIGILGFGVENQALMKWLIDHKITNIVICDKNQKLKIKDQKHIPKNTKIQYRLGKNYLKNLTDFDIVFRTPGLPVSTPELKEVKKKGVEISSQIKLFFDLCPAKIIGVTGTKGKGTTASLISEILKSSNRSKCSSCSNCNNFNEQSDSTISTSKAIQQSVYCGGNIGNPPIKFVDQLKSNDWVVLELSSFQLQDMPKSPNIAVVLDIKVDHLDYHKNRKEYIRAKLNIVRYQQESDAAVINMDYLTSFEFVTQTKAKNIYYFSRRKSVDLGVFVLGGKIVLRTNKKDFEICETKDVFLRGEHNLENISAAICTSYLAGAEIEAIKKIVPKFCGLEHRLEFVKEINGVKYYNDSFSTTPDTAIAAIKSFTPHPIKPRTLTRGAGFTEPIILILGGSEKEANYSLLGREIANSSVKEIIAIGVTGPKIIKKVTSHKSQVTIIKDLKNMQEIVKTAKKEAKKGDIVLLSPASASFGMFKNYKDRGNQFKEQVNKLTK